MENAGCQRWRRHGYNRPGGIRQNTDQWQLPDNQDILNRCISNDFFLGVSALCFFCTTSSMTRLPSSLSKEPTVPLMTLSAPNFSVKATARLLAPKILSSALFPCLWCCNTFYHMNPTSFLSYIHIYTTFKVEWQQTVYIYLRCIQNTKDISSLFLSFSALAWIA